jgi:epoxyqueuosine reductase
VIPMKTDGVDNWITAVIRDFCAGPENSLHNDIGEPAWGDPIVGFSQGDDPLFEQYKEYVGPWHLTPWEVFTKTFPDLSVRPDELAVISWILPQTSATKADNRLETVQPSERWARARTFGSAFNQALRKHLADALNKEGIPAIAPALSPLFEWKKSDKYVYASTWSERHAAFAAGLGTFGLCDGLITPVGKAVRIGSVVARVQIHPTPRPYTDYREYCLFYANGTCGECMARCPVGAITEAGHDKLKCREHVASIKEHLSSRYGLDSYGCGLCQTGVPCESGIPVCE